MVPRGYLLKKKYLRVGTALLIPEIFPVILVQCTWLLLDGANLFSNLTLFCGNPLLCSFSGQTASFSDLSALFLLSIFTIGLQWDQAWWHTFVIPPAQAVEVGRSKCQSG